MAVDKKISQLTSLAQVDVAASTDVLPIVDTSATETKKITVSALVGAGATAGLTNVDINSGTIDGTTIGASSASTGAFTTLSATGVTTLQAGSASAPAATTTGDTNTGIYFPAADQVAVTTGGTVAAAFNSNGLFFRNRIINGDMRIDQRNAGASVTIGAGGAYTLDRWGAYSVQASKFSLQQNAASVTPPTGFTSYLGVTSLSAYSVLTGDYFGVFQRIEGLNTYDLAWGTANARTVTLSFWVRSSLTGTFGGSVANSAYNRSYPFNYTISAANTWEQKSVTIPGDTSGTWLTTSGLGIEVNFGLGAGATYSGTANAWAGAWYNQPTSTTSVVGTNGATFYITGVQLETGSVATPFERRPYGTELMLCQRYYEKSYDLGTAPGTATVVGGFTYLPANTNTASTLYIGGTVKFSVVKRAGPTIRYWDWAGNLSRVSDLTLGALAITNNRNTIYLFDAGTSNTRIINTQDALTFTGFYWDAASEL